MTRPSPHGVLTPPPAFFHAQFPAAMAVMEGWCSDQKASYLFDLVRAERPTLSVELGVFGGRSLLAIACGHWCLNHGHVLGIDRWHVEDALAGSNDPENDTWWKELDASGKLEAICEDAHAKMRQFVPEAYWGINMCSSLHYVKELLLVGKIATDGFHIGLLHQDSNHSQEISCAELAAYRPYMLPGSVWVLDDAGWPSQQEVQRRMVADHGFTLEYESENAQWRTYRVPR